MAVLKIGDKGPKVRELQALLNVSLVPSPNLHVDGDFGPKTREVVVQFQKRKGLVPDGIVGIQTWGALRQRTVSVEPTLAPASTAAPWMTIAKAEVGVEEDHRKNHHTQKILDYHAVTTLKATTDETPWCSSFVNWVMTKTGYRGTRSAAASSWLTWGRSLNAPQPGAITVIKRKSQTQSDAATGSSSGYHVGFFVSATPKHIMLLGGNQGDKVRYTQFSLKNYEVKGYRWPIENMVANAGCR